jgi:hypothetical protein
VGKIFADLFGDHPPIGADGTQQGHGQRARAGAGFEDHGSRENIRRHHNRSQIFRVDHLRAAGHLQNILCQRRTKHHQGVVVGGTQQQSLFLPDDVVKIHGAGVIAILTTWMQGHQVETLFAIDHDHRLTGGKRTASRWHG